MHNDRDRTQYDGSQGQGRFRGFTAGQEGWLTDGEYGITGVSPERIFEFPQQERRRKTVIKRRKIPADSNRRVLGPWGPAGVSHPSNPTEAVNNGRIAYINNPPGFDRAKLLRDKALEYCRSQGYTRARNVTQSSQHFVDSPNLAAGPPYQFRTRLGILWTATCEKKVRR